MVFRDPIVPGAISCIGRLLYATSHVKESLNPFRHAPATSCRRSYPFSVEYCTERVASCPVSDARCVANPTLNAVLACASRLMSKAFVSVIQSPVRMHPRRSFPLHPDLPPPTLLHDTRMRIGFLLFSVRLLLARTGEKDTKRLVLLHVLHILYLAREVIVDPRQHPRIRQTGSVTSSASHLAMLVTVADMFPEIFPRRADSVRPELHGLHLSRMSESKGQVGFQ